VTARQGPDEFPGLNADASSVFAACRNATQPLSLVKQLRHVIIGTPATLQPRRPTERMITGALLHSAGRPGFRVLAHRRSEIE
jgi:hypothetical protein